MGTVVRLQFVHEILDVEIDRCLSDAKFICNLFVSVPIPNQPKDVQFPCGQLLLSQMLRDERSDLRCRRKLAGRI